ncbi:MAG: flavin-containing monooxygenase [Thermoleophilaceae bacterium]
MRVAIVGAGFSGIAMAIALRREGVEDFTVFERAEGLGGVWSHNTYPGAACDVPSYLYSFSYEQRRDWSRPCSPQAEILDYLHATAAKYGVDAHIRTRTEIARAQFDEEAARWRLETTDGESHEADALVVACGQLSRPRWPSVTGLNELAGRSFHSAEWDHDYDMTGKRVAVVGTGASAVQFVPPLADKAAHLDVYQRTAPYMLPRRNARYPGWYKRLIEHVTGVQALRRHGTLLYMEVMILGLIAVPPLRWAMSGFSQLFMRRQLHDPELRVKLRPHYPFGCKRILFSSYYLPALARRNVEVITDRVERVTERGVVAGGVEREVDCIVYATGFRANDFVFPMQVIGSDGRELQETWSMGAEAHLGIAVAGFPAMYMLYGPNTNLGVGSIIEMIEAQVGYVVDSLRAARSAGSALEVRPEVQRWSGQAVQRRLQNSIWTACESWYGQNSEGRVVNNWPGLMTEYRRRTRSFDPTEYREVRATVSGSPGTST